MFLLKVYRYHKWLFTGMLLFVIFQLYCFYKGGMVFSPFYNYGMYSEVIKPRPQYELYNVYADGKIMAGDSFTPQEWDAIHFQLSQAGATRCNTFFYKKEITRIFKKLSLPVPNQKYYINTLYSPQAIWELYPAQLAKKFSINQVRVEPMLYEWNGDSLIARQVLKHINNTSFQCK